MLRRSSGGQLEGVKALSVGNTCHSFTQHPAKVGMDEWQSPRKGQMSREHQSAMERQKWQGRLCSSGAWHFLGATKRWPTPTSYENAYHMLRRDVSCLSDSRPHVLWGYSRVYYSTQASPLKCGKTAQAKRLLQLYDAVVWLYSSQWFFHTVSRYQLRPACPGKISMQLCRATGPFKLGRSVPHMYGGNRP